jgi:hypothetical protein
MIFLIMNTISSSGLPDRHRLPESLSFRVILKVDPTVTTNKDRFDRPQTITDVCQGLDWWMEGDLNNLFEYLTPLTSPRLKRLFIFSFSSGYSSSDPSSVCSSFLLSPPPSSLSCRTDPMFKLDPYTMPTGDDLRDLTKQHWDPNLNKDYECPASP